MFSFEKKHPLSLACINRLKQLMEGEARERERESERESERERERCYMESYYFMDLHFL